MSYQLSVSAISYQLSAISYQLSAISYQVDGMKAENGRGVNDRLACHRLR
jgi:hypothetical protein